jgi:hypothetical protein
MPGGYSFDRFHDDLALRIKAMPEFRAKLADSQLNLDHPQRRGDGRTVHRSGDAVQRGSHRRAQHRHGAAGLRGRQTDQRTSATQSLRAGRTAGLCGYRSPTVCWSVPSGRGRKALTCWRFGHALIAVTSRTAVGVAAGWPYPSAFYRLPGNRALSASSSLTASSIRPRTSVSRSGGSTSPSTSQRCRHFDSALAMLLLIWATSWRRMSANS